MNAERKSIFITAAACGMGRATARLFAGNGWFVGIYDVDETGLEALAAEIGAENCHAAKLNVTERLAFQSVLRDFDARSGGRLDVLHSNAGIIRPWQKGLVERLGKYQRTVDSGLTIIIPMVESLVKVDMREQVVDGPPPGGNYQG
jgi:NAD(P)-dependent dehydrogenase (short-subunit alcohol dehydrogenase family)